MKKWEYRVLSHDKIGITGTTAYDSHGPDTRIGGTAGVKPKTGKMGRAGTAVAEYLNTAGQDGWELVSNYMTADKEGTTWYIFKRPLEDG